MSDVPTAARFAQIGYTSGRSGFGIHSEAGGPTESERELLVRGADPERTDFGQALPRFAAPDEVARFNRNLVGAPVSPGAAAAWHTAPAGADESGRTGNVFVHALLDRFAGSDGSRLIDTWRSPDWVTPYGAGEVRDSVLPEGAPRPGSVVGRRQVCEFVLDPATWRLGILSRLLDELSLPRGERGPVVLGVASPDVGALWVGAVAHLMSPGAAAGLGFGVWETSRALQSDRIARFDFVCMPVRELASVRERFPQITALTESDDATPREWSSDDTHGDRAWGALAVGMFSLAGDPASLLADLDALAQRVGDRDLARYWPLAMAMACRLDSWDFLSHPIAAALSSGSPIQLAGQADLLDVTVNLVGRHTGDTTADAWAALNASAPGPISAVLQRIYLGRAVADDAWLVQPGGAPARRDRGWNPADHVGLSAEVEHAIERIAGAGSEAHAESGAGAGGGAGAAAEVARAVTLVNLADLLVRTGWPTDDPDAICGGRLVRALDRSLRPALTSPSELDRFVSTARPTATTLHEVVRPALAGWPADVAAQSHLPIGRRLPVRALTWLYPADPAAGPLSSELTLLDVEALALAATAGRDEARHRARQRLLAQAMDLAAPEFAEARSQILAVVAESRPMRAAEVRALLGAGISPTDTQVAMAILMGTTDEANDVMALARDVLVQGRPSISEALQVLTVVASQPAWGAPDLEVAIERYAPKVSEAVTVLWSSARCPVGTLWAGHLAAAVELRDVRIDQRGFLAAVLPPSGTVVPGAADLFAALLMLPPTDQRTFGRLDMIALRAMASDPAFPRPLAPTSPPALTHALLDEDAQPALTSGLGRYYAGLSKDDQVATRDALVHLVESAYAEAPEFTDFARSWFVRVSGSKNVGDRLRNVGGRLFGRSNPSPHA
ncbi:MAG: hypothetical protein U0Q21_14275 [Dermatophilaceae bacterium]